MPRQNYRDLTHEQLVALLEARDRKKFGLVWERDAIEHDRALNDDFVALDEIPELGMGDALKTNLIIEGDNFDALRALRVAYAGKVKCIYIDPPYNTGNRDFVYNDRFVDKDHNWRHSMWLEFMFQRLTLARDLLAQDGAIFVSIDDNEIFHLGLLMNEVFGEENFVGNIIWQKKYTRANDAAYFSDNHDFVICYAQDKKKFRIGRVERTEAQDKAYKNPDGHPLGAWKATPLHAKSGNDRRPYTFKNGVVWEPPRGTFRRYSDENLKRFDENKEIWFGKDGMAIPQRKTFLGSLNAGVVPVTLWTHEVAGDNHIGRDEVKRIVPHQEFSSPKPTSLLALILQVGAVLPGDLVLDFFAGSGTTAHAVLKMNAENPNEPPRRFILVSNTEATVDDPDKNLCRDVCRQRVANVIAGYGDTPGTGGSFAYLRTRRIPMTRVVRKIEHAQVWLFLQLMHFGELAADAPLASGRLFARSTPEEAVFYPTTLTEAIVKRLENAVGECANATIYTWQPEVLAARLESPGLAILPIPQTLIDRFGPRP